MPTVNRSIARLLACLVLAFACDRAAFAGQTENHGMNIVPAPGAVKIDGNLDDWDLSGGNFACDDVENMRDSVSIWCFAMYDGKNLYLAAHFKDPTPMSNTGQTGAELMPFNSDSLQVRFITSPGTPQERVTHLTGWQGKGGKEVVDLTYGRDFHGGTIPDAKEQGGQQVFTKDADGKGYIQEISIPWQLLTADGKPLQAGEKFNMTWEANFSVREGSRLSVKDCFLPNVKIDRIFTFNAYSTWGWATLVPQGKLEPRAVRLADGREYKVSMDSGGQPIIAWESLAKDATSMGNKVIAFNMREDGFVSLIIKSSDGTVVRQLVNNQAYKQGEHEVRWDALTNPVPQHPGDPVAPGEYTWSAIYHTGVGLRLAGFASNAGRTPWDDGPTSNWGGDQGPPTYVAADSERVYLGWHQAEAGKGLLACDTDGNVIWHNNRGGFGGGRLLAADRGTVYNFDGNVLYRLDAKTGEFTFWEGTKSTEIDIVKLWDTPAGHPAAPVGMDAREGKLYLSFNSPLFLRSDIPDWRAFLARIQEDGSAEKNILGKRIWDGPGMTKELRDRLGRFVKTENADQKMLEGQAFVTEDVRDVVLRTLVDLQTRQPLMLNDAELSDEEIPWANRRHIEQEFGSLIAKAASPCVVTLDAATGEVLGSVDVERPSEIKAIGGDQVLAISRGRDVIRVNAKDGTSKNIVKGINGAKALTIAGDGTIYVGVRDPDNQVRVYDKSGQFLRAIGEPGGRPALGAWVAEGLAFINSVAVDAKGNLWVVETDDYPKRISKWDAQSGKLVKEFFGPTHYGASGAAIDPDDANRLVGEGCEWRIDPKTGQASCLGVFSREQADAAMYCKGSNGKTYVLASQHDALRIFERLGEGQFALRGAIVTSWADHSTTFWADENGDAQQQPGEVKTFGTVIRCGGGWYINAAPDLTLYGGTITKEDVFTEALQLKVVGFTACGAPKYDPDNAHRLPKGFGSILPSPDQKLVLYRGSDSDATFRCYEVATGKQVWTYPNPFAGVHGSHAAPPPAAGLIRGSFGIVGTAKLPDPIGSVWAINTNVGEWHLLTEQGFYLTSLFEGDPTKVKFPTSAEPGAVLDHSPPGLGGEDFGGSFMQTSDGQIYAQAGKVGIWKVQVVGLENVKPLATGSLTISDQDARDALGFREQQLQSQRGVPRATVVRATVTFSGDLQGDFKGAPILSYRRQDDASVRSAMAWDDANLYVAWEVQDASPWLNSATEVESLYIQGDTVDLQLGTNPQANKERGEAVAGDLRLSIGNFKGTPTGVLYRKVSDEKKPKTFSSGVTHQTYDYVDAVKDLTIKVTKLGDNAYLVEAAIPLSTIALKPEAGMTLQGDIGVTHGDPSGSRTRLRTYWSNQHTGIVDDAVFELQLEPRNWGQITFQP